MVEFLADVVMPAAIFVMMFAMGLTLSLKDFRQLIVFPKNMLAGLFIQLIILPFLGLLLANYFGLNAMVAVGFVALAATPGGSLSNVVTHLGNGNTALSILLTVVGTVFALFTLPLWINRALSFFSGTGVAVNLPVLRTAMDLGLFTVLPLFIGIFIVSKYPLMVKWEKLLSRGGALTTVFVFIAVTVIDEAATLTNPGILLLPCLILITSAILLGYGLPKLLGAETRDGATIAVELCMKNVLLPIFVAMHCIRDHDAALASTVYMAGMVPVGVTIMVIFNYFRKRETLSSVGNKQ